MQSQTVTLVVAGLGIGGTLASGVASQWMTRRSQRNQWLRDNTLIECRELLGALATSNWAILQWKRQMKATAPLVASVAPGILPPNTGIVDKVCAANFENSLIELDKVFGHRLLIARAIMSADIQQRWLNATSEFMREGNDDDFDAAYRKLCDEIVQMGLDA